jgi:ferric-dicitrate binding protein FerR (iron transport regulator)
MRFARETAPDEHARRRVRRRLDQEPDDGQLCRALLAHLPTTAPGAEARVRVRLAATSEPALRPARTWLWVGAGLGTAAATAAGLLLALPDPMAAPVRATLTPGASVQSLAPSPEVTLAFQGSGLLDGTRQAPHLQWESGTVHVEVEPGRGIQLSVATREAQVHVVGTAFSVTRDALGTQVEVEHGQVSVTCLEGPATLLGAEQSTTCLPTSAAGMLTRARTLLDQGAAPDLVLATADLALERFPDQGALRGELELVRLQALTDLGRDADALHQAQSYLAEGSALRRIEVLQLAARLAWSQGGCDAAMPHLAELTTLDPSIPLLVRLADCQAPQDPESARTRLQQAEALHPDERWAEAIRQRLEQL